jgi:hypothetical protein
MARRNIPGQSAHMLPDAWRNRLVRTAEVAPASLVPHPLNWRQHPQYQREALQGVLSEVGWVQQVLVNERTGHLLDGHLRVALAVERGEVRIPVGYVDLSEEEERLVLITLDPLAALAQTDAQGLTALLAEVQSGDGAVQHLLRDLADHAGVLQPEPPPVVDVEPHVDRAEELRHQWEVEPGQLWALGEHRVLCGDCLEDGTLERLLGTQTPDMVFADPPYGVNIVATNGYVGGGEAYDIPFGGVQAHRRRGHVGGGEAYKAKHGHFPIQRDRTGRGSVGGAKPCGSKKVRGTDGAAHVVDVGKYAPVEGDASPATAIAAATALLAAYPEAIHVWWGGNYYASALPDSSCWLIWDKETTGHFADCELAWTNQSRATRLFKHRWNGMLRDSERSRRWHPTQKPVALAAWVFATLRCDGDVVLDPFLGSGPSLLAGEQRGKRVYGCEMRAEYIAVALQRWVDLTGNSPERL